MPGAGGQMPGGGAAGFPGQGGMLPGQSDPNAPPPEPKASTAPLVVYAFLEVKGKPALKPVAGANYQVIELHSKLANTNVTLLVPEATIHGTYIKATSNLKLFNDKIQTAVNGTDIGFKKTRLKAAADWATNAECCPSFSSPSRN